MRRAACWALLAPLIAVQGLLLVYPVAYAVRLAFTDPLTGAAPTLRNYAQIASDPLFWRAARNNALLPLASVAVELLVGLTLALWLSRRFRGRGALRLLVVLPFALPEIVVLTMMRYVFLPRGYANAALLAVGLPAVDWLVPGSPLAWLTVVLVDAWHVTPVVFLVLLAGLAGIPDEVGEAARLDGAGAAARLWYVTLPLLRPALLAALLLRGVDALRLFATPLVLTGVEGVPVLSSYAYHQWADYGNDAAAAAAASVLAVGSVALSLPLLRQREGW
ncbi:MAG: sugar ABC transporter permease [Deltaproteobacteria bacterium]|nr:sugar ABC transporter permease [Deltaproteobacteria bacterium]